MTKYKKTILTALLLVFINSVIAFHEFNTAQGPYGHLTLDEPSEALVNFVAPFLLITIIFQIGFERALNFTFAEDDGFNQVNNEDDLKRYSIVMALSVAAILVPTDYFVIFNYYLAFIFGSISYLLFGAMLVAFLYLLWKALGR